MIDPYGNSKQVERDMGRWNAGRSESEVDAAVSFVAFLTPLLLSLPYNSIGAPAGVNTRIVNPIVD